MARHNRKYLKPKRQALRNNLTPAESALWRHLKQSQLLNRKFRRQHSIFNFIVDFYCPGEKLIIELDGEYHQDENMRLKDAARDAMIHAAGYRVIRFENEKVFTQLEFVLDSIEACFKQDEGGG